MIPTNMDILVKTLRRGEIRKSLRIIFNIANPPFVHSKKTGQQIMSLLLRVVKENKIMLLLVTHDPDIAHTCDTIFRMDEGRICYVENDS